FLYRTDADGIFTFVAPSAENLLGIAPHMLLGKAIQNLYVKPEQRRELLKQLHASKAGRIEDFRVELRHANGGTVWFSNHVHMIYDEHGVFSGVEGIARDLTDLKQMEEQFYQAQKMESLGTLVGGISHDFNNMLASMTGTLYLMKSKLSQDKDLLKSVEVMETQAFRASDMIKQLLSFARKGEVNLHKISLTELFLEVKDLLVKTVPENIKLHIGTVDEDLDVLGDASLLQQVWMNLVNNARDALVDTVTPEIRLSLKQCMVNSELLKQHPELEEGSLYAQLTVSDNGKGIAKEHQQHIFEPFFTTKKKYQGTGLGLAMIYGAVKSHQGWLNVESELGKGSSFHVYIPLQKSPESSILTNLKNSIPYGHGEVILVVDDDDMIRDVSCELLESLNYKVLQASDGVEALSIFHEYSNEIDLLLTDVVMPNMGGWELSTQIWLQKNSLPIIFISGYADEQIPMLPEELEHVIILKKPCSIENLSQSIEKLLDSNI
ncbi:MAG: ATP-binding protein, partial [Mariprofundaceae bacterium]|nr:ATP-binding protein [Mariprofundaceae bacterium]